MSDEKFLKIKTEIESLQQMYKDDKGQQTFNCLLLGGIGTGKTHMIQTARRPIHVDSFDPGGTKHLQKGINEGWIIVDTRYEAEDIFKPYAFDLWLKEMTKRKDMGYFDYIGTYALDSLSMFQEAIMNRVLKNAGIAGKPPRFTHDYMPAKTDVKNTISLLTHLPCDVIITGHLQADKDETVGTISMRMVSFGNLDTTLPGLFDEIYITEVKDTSKGPEYTVLTSPKGYYRHARTRMGSQKFEQFEKPDIKYLLQKAGRDSSDRKETNENQGARVGTTT